MISICPKCKEPVSIPAGVDASSLVRCPICSKEYLLAEPLRCVPPELIVVGAPMGDSATSPSAAPPAAGDETTPDVEADANLASELGIARQSSGMAMAPPWRERKQKSAVQTLVEVVLGGVAGCLVAYYGLAFWFGPQFHRIGLPRLPLPWIDWITSPKDADGKPNAPNSQNYNHGELLTRRLLADASLDTSTSPFPRT